MSFITPNQVLQGYMSGIFPMADPDDFNAIYWYEPENRGIIPLDGMKISKSLRKTIEKGPFEVTLNRAFEEVIAACAEREETWISEEIQQIYIELHRAGWAHSIEVWKNKKLVGGLYGVAIKRAFFGESMFHTVTDASKVALYHLVEWLRDNDFLLLDTQYITPHLASLGAIEIPKEEFKKLLAEALAEF